MQTLLFNFTTKTFRGCDLFAILNTLGLVFLEVNILKICQFQFVVISIAVGNEVKLFEHF